MSSFILLVGLGREESKRPVLESLLSAGVEVRILANARPRGASWKQPPLSSDKIILADFRTAEDVIEAVRAHISTTGTYLLGILTYLEETVILAQTLMTHFGLPCITRGNIRALRHKGMMRGAVKSLSIPQPQYHVCRTKEEYLNALQEIGLPAIVKPAELLGSIGVRKIDHHASERDLEEAFENAKGADRPDERFRDAFPLSTDVLVESYVQADREVSVEGLVCAGQFTVLSITEKYLGGTTGFHEFAHLTPSPYVNATLHESITKAVGNVCRALQLNFTAVHAELRIEKEVPYFVEIGARLGGDLIPLLVNKAFSYSFPSAALTLSTGKTPRPPDRATGLAGILFFEDESLMRRGVRGTNGIEEISLYSGNGSRKGHVLWYGADLTQWENLVVKMRSATHTVDLRSQRSD